MKEAQQSRSFISDGNPTSLSTGSYFYAEFDQLLNCDIGIGNISIDLLAIGNKCDYEYKLYVMDSGGYHSSSNIKFNHILNCIYVMLYTLNPISDCDDSICTTEDYTKGTYIYSMGYDTKVTRATKGSWLLYRQNRNTSGRRVYKLKK